jgi:hypothetical protein
MTTAIKESTAPASEALTLEHLEDVTYTELDAESEGRIRMAAIKAAEGKLSKTEWCEVQMRTGWTRRDFDPLVARVKARANAAADLEAAKAELAHVEDLKQLDELDKAALLRLWKDLSNQWAAAQEAAGIYLEIMGPPENPIVALRSSKRFDQARSLSTAANAKRLNAERILRQTQPKKLVEEATRLNREAAECERVAELKANEARRGNRAEVAE